MSRRISLVIFDLDGTLVDAYRAVARSLNHVLAQLGQPPETDEAIKRAVGWGDRDLISRFVAREDLDKALSIYRQHHARALKDGTVFLPGARRLLVDLKSAGYQLAIASNRPTRFTQIILKHLGAQEFFTRVICADKVPAAKPAPDLLLWLLEKSGTAASEALYVGDMTIDVTTGHAAGVRMVAVLTGSSTREEIEALAPYRIIGSVSELRDILENDGPGSVGTPGNIPVDS